MPLKPGEETPNSGDANMSDEARKEIVGGSGARQGKGAREEGDETPERHQSGPSESGSNKMPNHPQNT